MGSVQENACSKMGSVQDFVFYGRSGLVASSQDDQEKILLMFNGYSGV